MLHLEITETALITDSEKQQTTVNRLRNYGFQVEIDDFGSGFSSLSMLKDLPVDTLKIDMEFLRETENKSRSRTILESILQMSAALGMNVICEGVENKAQFEFLKGIGCGMYQGYYFSKPCTRETFITLLPATRICPATRNNSFYTAGWHAHTDGREGKAPCRCASARSARYSPY